MNLSLKDKTRNGLFWLFFLIFSLQPIVYAQTANGPSVYSQLESLGLVVLLAPVMLGAMTGALVKTAVDNTFPNPKASKFFIGIGFGICATLGLGRYYSKLLAVDLIFPAYILSTLGTPVVVYACAIVSDGNSWQLVMKWVKRRFGIDDDERTN